ncbi:PREDICTED: cholinephosphotransferase 1 [Dipodomys ordii]|uniref:Cholinephosphotransferase 1 n=1 Tax=Dipodomys ordii TaxID=10020 RepID=A0A1S3FDE8_DIPOR|nr:PREDICTED: cholinephosphotransferase 1 [Dipodomys ordii]
MFMTGRPLSKSCIVRQIGVIKLVSKDPQNLVLTLNTPGSAAAWSCRGAWAHREAEEPSSHKDFNEAINEAKKPDLRGRCRTPLAAGRHAHRSDLSNQRHLEAWRLEEHRYCAAGASLLEPPLQLYWTWLLQWIPLWMAPNTITLIGLAVNMVTTLLLVSYCPTVTEEAPYWTYLLCALGLFIYQSLDAIDGKQARRTNSCSPLGELFDHGCDSLSTVFMAVGASIAVRLGTHPDWLFFCSFIGMFMFYCAHWQTYVSGVLRFGKVDVTEIQVALVIVFVLSTFGGATIWDYTIPILEIKLKIFPVLGVVGGAIFSCSNYFHVILHGGVGKNGSTIAGTSVLSPGLHIGLIIILAIMIYKKSATNVFEKHPCLYTLMFGCVFAKIAQKLVIAHMTKSELYLQDTVFVGPGLLFLDQYFNNFIDEYIVLWIAMVLSSFDMMIYFSSLCLQISRHLHLSIFKTSYHQAPEQVHKHID